MAFPSQRRWSTLVGNTRGYGKSRGPDMRRNQRRNDRRRNFQIQRSSFLWTVTIVFVLLTLTISGCRNRDQNAPSLLGKASGPTRVVPPATGAAVAPQTTPGTPSVSTNSSTYPAANAWNYSVQSSASPVSPTSPAPPTSSTSSTSATPSVIPTSNPGVAPATTGIPIVPAPPTVNTAPAAENQPLPSQDVGGTASPRRVASTNTNGTNTNLVWRNPTTGVAPASATLSLPTDQSPSNTTAHAATTPSNFHSGLTPIQTVTPTAPTTASGRVLPVVYYPTSAASVAAIPTTSSTTNATAGPKANPTRNATRNVATTATSLSSPVSEPQTQSLTSTTAPILRNIPASTGPAEGETRWETGPAPTATDTPATVLPSGVVLPHPVDITTSR